MKQETHKIYWHWTGTGYSWAQPLHYHSVITDKGAIKYLTPYSEKLDSHTFGRNTNSVSIAVACMGGKGWQDFPPQEAQIESLCQETVRIMRNNNWGIDKVNINTMMTHAEAAANRDFPKEVAKKVSGMRPISSVQEKEFDAVAQKLGMPHCNYGPTSWYDGWPGSALCIRWDLWQIKPSDPGGSGGFKIRDRVREIYNKLKR